MLLRLSSFPFAIPGSFLYCLFFVAHLYGNEEGRSNRETPIVRAVKATRPSVVSINGRKTIRDEDAPYGSKERFRKVNGMGTGIIIDERGYIITNYHVVQGVANIRVTLADKTQTSARLVAHDPKTDLAVIKINVEQLLQVMPRGTSSDLMLGETVIAIGNAYGYKDTITLGIISELSRTVEVSDEQTYYNLIQTDAAINPGNSGGPLVNIDGELIGINVAVRMGAQSIGFAIPVNPALEIVAELIRKDNGGRNSLPIIVSTDFKLDQPRLLVRKGFPGLDIQNGDEITEIDGRAVSNLLDLERLMIGRTEGDKIALRIRRGTQSHSVESKIVSQQTRSRTKLGIKVWDSLGIRLSEISVTQFQKISTKFRGGLQVIEVRDGSQAMRQNIRSGDVLLGIHEWETTSLGHIAYIIEQEKILAEKPVEFFVLRNGEVLKGSFRLAALEP
ncbi:MAG: trypsin-like peptidase domain-containing protein [Pirellulaceae bacterium]|nr:trypsin-like peptidase domain-containing protein [Pirellulaceae bacterium]